MNLLELPDVSVTARGDQLDVSVGVFRRDQRCTGQHGKVLAAGERFDCFVGDAENILVSVSFVTDDADIAVLIKIAEFLNVVEQQGVADQTAVSILMN